MGAITDIVKKYVPVSYRALCGVTNNFYSLTELQDLSDTVQYRLFATVAGSTQEASVYNRTELELLGTISTMQFIPAAIEFWGTKLESEGTRGTSENVSYFDQRPDLWKVYDKLAAQAGDLAIDAGVNLRRVKAVLPRVSYGDNGRNILISPDPVGFGAPYGTTFAEDLSPWSYPV